MYDRMNYVHGNGAKAVLVAVYGNRAVEDALLEMSDLCLNRGFKVVGGAEIDRPALYRQALRRRPSRCVRYRRAQ